MAKKAIASFAAPRQVVDLVRKSDEHRDAIQPQIDATDRQIDQLVYEFYGLSDKEIALVEEATASK
jgi:hypothetical protein